MSDLIRALGISAGILLSVVVLTIIISMVAVNRGAAQALGIVHEVPEIAPPVKAAAGKGAAVAGDEISVSMILLLGLGLFTATVVALLLLSLIAHM